MLLRDAPVSIDIGSFSVKVAQVQGGRGGVRALRFAEERVPDDFHWEAGASAAPLAAAIRQAMRRAGIRSRRAVFAIPRRHVIVRTSVFPPAERAQLARVVEMDLADHIPFPVEQVVVDFQALGPSAEQPGMVDVLVVAAQRDLVRQYLELARVLRMTVAALSVDSFALHDLVSLRKEEAPGVQLAMEVGRRSIAVNVSEGRRLRLSRSFPLGGLQLSAAMRDDFGLSPEEAELRRLTEGLQVLERTPRPPRVAAWVDNVRGEMRRTALSVGQAAISRVYLVGAGAQTPGLAQAVGAEFGVAPILLSAASLFPTAQLRGPDPSAADRCLLALGMGLAGVRRSGFTISLLPREVTQARRQALAQRLAIAATLLLAGLLAMGYTTTKRTVKQLRGRRAALAAEVRTKEVETKKVQELEGTVARLSADLRELEPAHARRYVALELLRTISEGANPGIIITSFQLRPQQPLRLQGTAPAMGAAADLQAVLLRSPLVTRVSLDQVERLAQGGRTLPAFRTQPAGRAPAGDAAAGPEARVNFFMTVQLRTEKAPKVKRTPGAARGGRRAQ